MSYYRKITLIALSIACIGFSLWNVINYMVNIPDADDYGVFLGFINGMVSDDSSMKKFGYFFSLQNEHRPFTVRMISYLQFLISGKVNFVLLMIMGNLMWVIAFYLLVKKYHLNILSLPFLVLLVLFFNLNHWENMLWATGSLQNFGVICFSLAAFNCSTLYTKKQVLALCFAGLALYTSGNGLFALLITSGYVLLRGKWHIKIMTIIYTATLIILYFLHYQSPNYLHSPTQNLIQRPFMIIEYLLTYFSGSFYLIGIHDRGFILITGGVIIILSFIAFFKSINKDWFTSSIILFCLLSGFSAAISRSELGILQAATPRYQVINSLLYFSMGYFFLKRIKLTWYVYLMSILALCYGYSFAYIKNRTRMIEYHQKYLKTAYCHNKTTPTDVYVYPVPIIAWAILIQSEELKTYTLPKLEGEYNCEVPSIKN